MKRLISILTLLTATAAHANSGSLSLAPAVTMVRGEPGQSTTQTLRLRNDSSRTLSFDVVAVDVVVRDGKRVLLDPGLIPASIAATAVFSQRHLTIASGDTAAVTATFTIPSNASTRAVIALLRGTDKINDVAYSLGSLITFTLSDGATLVPDPLRVRPQSATSNLGIVQLCTNVGTEPVIAKGMLAIVGADGRIAGQTTLPQRRLLPGERMDLGTEYGAELQPGRYRLLVTYDYDGKALTQSADVTVP